MEAHEVRLYPDTPIAGMRGTKEAVFITLTYDFDDYSINVENVFAWRDSETQEEFVPADVAVLVGEEVRRFAALIEQFLAAPRQHPANIRDFALRMPSAAADIPA